MASKILQPVRGTRDLIDGESRRHRHVVETGRAISALYGASEWQTPIFEMTPVFSRSLGETSDVVTKEMYTFDDRGGDSITLRPEGTAAICRALVSNGLTQTLPQKIFYAGPMFRYERPQKGRLRQFHQIGLELLGADTPLADAEAIACGQQILEALGVADRAVLNINTLGDSASRDAYRAALVAYFSRHENDLSEDSRMRLARNPLRILDSKDPDDIGLVADAPVIVDHLTNEARDFYERLKDYLVVFDVAFTENPRIVRGLDYYNNTAFEFVTEALGAQGTVLAGGRYDGLVAEMGGPPVPGIGWAAGIERLAMLIADPAPDRGTVAIVPLDETLERPALGILRSLREAGIAAEIAYRGNARRRLERANRSGAVAAVIVGPEEFARGAVAVKSLADGSQREVALDDLAAALA